MFKRFLVVVLVLGLAMIPAVALTETIPENSLTVKKPAAITTVDETETVDESDQVDEVDEPQAPEESETIDVEAPVDEQEDIDPETVTDNSTVGHIHPYSDAMVEEMYNDIQYLMDEVDLLKMEIEALKEQ